MPSLQGGRVSEKNLVVSALQAAESTYSVNNGHIKLIWKISLSGG